jgi:hypothetical protein
MEAQLSSTEVRAKHLQLGPLADHGRGRGPKPRLHRPTAADTTRAIPVALAPQNSRPGKVVK